MSALSMVSMEWLLAWWNLIFVLPLALGILYLGLYIATGLTFGEADMDADASGAIEHDVDVDADASGAIEHDVDVDADSDAGIEHHPAIGHGSHAAGDQDHPSNPLLDVLSWLGAKRVPLSFMLMIFMFCWGISGLVINVTLQGILPWFLVPVASIPLALCISVLATRWTSHLVGRYMPMDETSARSKESLVGFVGEALTNVDGKFGLVQVRTRSGDLIQVPCRVAGDRTGIAKGSRVLLADYQKAESFFYVVPDELGMTRNAS